MDVVDVVGGIVRQVGLERSAGEDLRLVFRPAAPGRQERQDGEREDGAHDALSRYDCRSSRIRDFLPTRPRR